MDRALINNWNSVIQDGDRIYLLGDVAINRKCLPILNYLRGRKVLVKGNHDIFKLKDYTPYFDDIRSYVVGKCHDGRMYIMSHIPIHPDCLGERFAYNIHGHLHSNLVMKHSAWSGKVGHRDPDERYVNVSVEQIDFTPKDLNEIIK